MKTHRHFRAHATMMASIGVILAFISGCSRSGPVGQFDDGTYGIYVGDKLIGALYAHYDPVDLGKSYEFWAVDKTKYCSAAPCQLGGATFRYLGEAKDVAEWSKSLQDSKYPVQLRYFRATYGTSTAGALSCSATGCTVSPETKATSISMFPPGTYGVRGQTSPYVVVTQQGSQFTETWCMEKFFGKDTSVLVASADPSQATQVEDACKKLNLKLDVQYQECKQAPTNSDGCR